MQTCCCMRLRTGGLVVGWLGIVGGIINLIACIVLLANVDAYVNNPEMNGQHVSKKSLIAQGVTSLVATLIGLVISGFLINGINKNRHKQLLPWLIVGGIGLVVLGISFVIGVVGLLIHGAIGGAFGVFIIGGAIIALEVYIYMAIHALYTEIKLSGGHNPY